MEVTLDTSAGLTQDYQQCRHETVYGKGHTKAGSRIMRCEKCRKSWVIDPKRRVTPLTAKEVRKIFELCVAGSLTHTQAAVELNLSVGVIEKYSILIRKHLGLPVLIGRYQHTPSSRAKLEDILNSRIIIR